MKLFYFYVSTRNSTFFFSVKIVWCKGSGSYFICTAWEAKLRAKKVPNPPGGFVIASFYHNLSHLSLYSGSLGDTWSTLSFFLPVSIPLSSLTSYRPLSPSPSPLSLPACLGDTWLGLSLILGRLFPADEGFAWQHSAARHEHNKKWRTTCQSPCQCRHEMKGGGRGEMGAWQFRGRDYKIVNGVLCDPLKGPWPALVRTQAKQVFSFFFSPSSFSLYFLPPLPIFLYPCEKLITCGLSLRYLSHDWVLFFPPFFFDLRCKNKTLKENIKIRKQTKTTKFLLL